MAVRAIGISITVLWLALHISGAHSEGKSLSLFNYVKFDNTICKASDTRNGTCYTKDECATRGGTASGECASGYGICCIFSLSCGGSSSENNTYLIQSSITSLSPANCQYKICAASTDICRIRFDFTEFTLAGPYTVATAATGAANAATLGGSIGDCLTDTFSIRNMGSGPGTPVICGLNKGQHMIVDADRSCSLVNFYIGASTATSRQWNIMVTQYACGDINAGPPGCLQYHTGVMGQFASFNFPTDTTSVSGSATHLSSQRYKICIRRELNFCSICYSVAIDVAQTITSQDSFGISAPATTTGPLAEVNTNCAADYLIFPTLVNTASATPYYVQRVCGRFFAESGTSNSPTFPVLAAAAAHSTLCDVSGGPYYIGVNFDADEVTGAATTVANEALGANSGTIGFILKYTQSAC